MSPVYCQELANDSKVDAQSQLSVKKRNFNGNNTKVTTLVTKSNGQSSGQSKRNSTGQDDTKRVVYCAIEITIFKNVKSLMKRQWMIKDTLFAKSVCV